MERYHDVRHFLNEDEGYGFSIALDSNDPGAMYFDCFMVVQLVREDDSWKPVYLLKEHQADLQDYYQENDEDYTYWDTEDMTQAAPIMSGKIEWTGTAEINFEAGDLYFQNAAQARELGKLLGHIYDLAREFVDGLPEE